MYVARVICNVVRRSNGHSYFFKQKRKLYLYKFDKNTVNPLISLKMLQYSSNSPAKCWKCNYAYKSELFCSKCKTLQEMPENLNFFDILGVKLDYNINHKEIHEKYRQLQKMLHPDKFGNKSERERQISESLSSLLNKAYSTLTHPLKRGLYMLQLNNVEISEETTSLNPEFLMNIMERNEAIEKAMNDKQKVIKLMDENTQILNALSEEVAIAFHNKNIEKAKETLIKMKYYTSIEMRLRAIKQNLGIVD